MGTETKKTQIPAEAFVRAYQAASSVAEVSAALGLKPASVSQRANSLRKQNVNLKKFEDGRGGKRLDIDALNATIESLSQSD